MSDHAAPDTTGLREVLGEHWFRVYYPGLGGRDVGCACGWRQPEDNNNRARHNAHLADVTADWLAARVADAVEQERAARLALVAKIEALAELPTPGPAILCASPKDRDDQWRAAIRALLTADDTKSEWPACATYPNLGCVCRGALGSNKSTCTRKRTGDLTPIPSARLLPAPERS